MRQMLLDATDEIVIKRHNLIDLQQNIMTFDIQNICIEHCLIQVILTIRLPKSFEYKKCSLLKLI